MNSIYDIVDKINQELTGVFNSCKLSASELNGISETVTKDPNIFQPELNGVFVGIDDKFSVRVYHKLSSLTSTIQPNTSYGRDSLGKQINTFGLGMIIFLNYEKAKLYPDELLLYIQANFPSKAIMKPFTSITIRFTGGVLDNRAIHLQEYGSASEYRLKAKQFLFRINYTVEMIFDQNCFKNCP